VLNQAREMVEKLQGLRQLLINPVNEKYELNAARSVEYTCEKISNTAAFVTGTVTVRNRRHVVDFDNVGEGDMHLQDVGFAWVHLRARYPPGQVFG